MIFGSTSRERGRRIAQPAIVTIVVALFIGCVQNASAADRFWLGNSGLWSTSANWNPALVPDPSDRVIFNTVNHSVVQFVASIDVDRIDVEDGSTDFVSSDSMMHTVRAMGAIGINLSGGSLSSSVALTADAAVTVQSQLEMLAATLRCDNLIIGTASNGTVSTSNANVELQGGATIGNENGGFGQLTMDAGQFIPISFPVVVNLNNGSVNCINGVDFTTTIFNMLGSATQTTSSVASFSGGGRLAANVTVGNDTGPGTAMLTIADGTLLTCSTLTVRSTGTLNILNALCSVLDGHNNYGTMIVEQSTVFVNANFFNNYGTLEAGGLFYANSVLFGELNNYGDFYVGGKDAVGTLEANNFRIRFNPAGTTHIDLGGTAANQFDQLSFAGNFNVLLRGIWKIQLVNGFTPALNDEFTIVAPSPPISATITASNYTIVPPAGYSMALIASGTSAVLRVTGVPCFADLSGNDNVVDIFDLFALLSNWNTAGTGAALAPPLNTVDIFDLFALLSAWGACP